MPQWWAPEGIEDGRSAADQAEFDLMLGAIPDLYLTARVHILLDTTYASRFCTSAGPRTLAGPLFPLLTDPRSSPSCNSVLGCFVLMRELLPAMPRGGRVVCVASELAHGLNLDDLQSRKLEPYHPISVYAASKLDDMM